MSNLERAVGRIETAVKDHGRRLMNIETMLQKNNERWFKLIGAGMVLSTLGWVAVEVLMKVLS